MNCKNPGCGNKDRIRPIEGQGSFRGFDVFQCPSCRQVAHTAKRDLSYDKPLAGIKKAKKIKKSFPGPAVNPQDEKIFRRQRIMEQVKNEQQKKVDSGLNKLRQRRANQQNINKSLPERIKSFIGRQPAATPKPTASNLGTWNTTKVCGKKGCGYSKNVVGGSQKDIDLAHCPKCKTKMQSKPFSPNF